MQTNFFHRGADDGPHPRPQPQYDVPATAGELKKIFSDCDDFEARAVRIGLESRLTVTVCWLDGMVSAGDVSTDVLRPLTEGGRLADIASTREAVRRIEQGAVYSCSTRTRTEMDDVVSDLTNGSVALVFDAQRRAVTFEVRTANVRAVSEPTIEKSVSGSKDAFVETLRINTSLVRRKLHTPALKLQQTVVGRQSETTVAVLYVDGIADPARVQRILDKLDTIDEQALLGRGDLEPYLTQRPRALLPQLGQTERPDKFAGELLDGCVGLLVDGLPMGYLLPTTFRLLMHAPEDESHHYLLASALIVLRYFALAISLTFPALYVAVAMYHQEMIPAKLLLSVIQAKQQVPFSVPTIILFMLIAFELLQEAGLRLPNSIGQTVSIIGALLVGQSAVDAKVVSPVAIIVVALAGIAGYTLPNQELSNAVRLLRLGLVLAAALAGLFGILAALVPLLLFAWILEGILHRGRPGEGIGEITLRALGPVAGRVLLGVYALWFLLYSAFALRIGAERFIEAVFPLSRPWPFVVTILAMAVCGALGSTKALFRASEIFLPLLMLVLALVLVFAVPGLNVNNLLPVTAQDLPGVARSGLTVFGIGAAVLFFGAFTGGRTPPAPGQGRAAVWWCVRMCVLVTLLSAFAIGILGAELTAKLTHPFFTMLRNVSLFHAVERFGALVIGLWVLPDFVLVSMLLTLAVNCLRAACSRDGRLFAQKNPPALVLLCAAAAGAGALFLAQNAFETDALQASVVPVVNIVLLGVGTVGMYLIGRARGKI